MKRSSVFNMKNHQDAMNSMNLVTELALSGINPKVSQQGPIQTVEWDDGLPEIAAEKPYRRTYGINRDGKSLMRRNPDMEGDFQWKKPEPVRR